MKREFAYLEAEIGGYFPGGHAGASLKLDGVRHSLRVHHGFPRRTRRGLIEAREPTLAPTAVREDFPGGHAGASLKRGGHLPRAAVHLGISPADTPGPH